MYMMRKSKVKKMTKHIFDTFKHASADTEVYIECGLDSMNNVIWANLVNEGKRESLNTKTFTRFFEEGYIRPANENNIEWLMKKAWNDKTEKLYRCVVIDAYLKEPDYSRITA